MVGTQKWSMEEILWVIMMVKQGLKDEEIYEKFCGIFKNARHVRGPNSIKYCRTGFMRQEEYSQEKYWEDIPGKIGFVLGRHDAGAYNGQIVGDVLHHFPAHMWAPHIKPLARCIEFVITKYRKLQNRFSDYAHDSPLVEPVLHLNSEGVSPDEIFQTANENGISLDDIYYIIARFGMEVKSGPTPWDNTSYNHHPGPSFAGPSTTQASSTTVKPEPLIFQLPLTDSYKKPKPHGVQHNPRRASDTSSRLSHHRQEYGYISGVGNQVTYHGAQRDLGASLLNSGYPQGISSDMSSQAQHHDLQNRSQPELFQPSQQHPMGLYYSYIPHNGQMQYPVAQQNFEQRSIQGYTGNYPDPTIQRTISGQFQLQNWGNNSIFRGQQIIPQQPQNIFGDHQQAFGYFGQRNYGPSQAGHIRYQVLPDHNLNQAFYGHPQRILAQEHQQPTISVTGYENIDPALVAMDANQAPRQDVGMMTLSQPPPTPQIAAQDFLHPFAYPGIQNGQDISPLTIENPQLPVLLPPSPEVTHDEFEHGGQLTIPNPYAQGSVLTELLQLELRADLHHCSETNGFDQDTFNQALTLSSETHAATLGYENSRESINTLLDIPDQCDDQRMNAESLTTKQACQNSFQSPDPTLHTTVQETVVSTPITNQDPLSEAQPMELDSNEEAVTLEELLELFPDLVYQNPQGCNFNYDGSMVGSGDIDPFENVFPKNIPEPHGLDPKSSLEAIEALSKVLETEIAGPFLTQNPARHNNDSGGIQCGSSRVFEGGHAPEGTCCPRHHDFECYYEISDSDGESANVSKR
ncbi:hypothetical protein V491_06076 [Pseudogymnoascus sp. VKM F-3775]|nr:hypothetical protein V491_06076 [Pseudogymnoascus sp. VKM F-3775]